MQFFSINSSFSDAAKKKEDKLPEKKMPTLNYKGNKAR
jgi:hypothetical protein